MTETVTTKKKASDSELTPSVLTEICSCTHGQVKSASGGKKNVVIGDKPPVIVALPGYNDRYVLRSKDK